MRYQLRFWRRCSRSSWPVLGSSKRTNNSSHCTRTTRPIQPGGAPCPAFFPAIQVGLACFQTLEAESFQRCLLRVANARFDFAFAIWILDATGHGDSAIVGEHLAIQRVERGVVDVGDEDALAKIVVN